MNKPDNITNNDWQLLVKKHPNKLSKLIKKINKGYPIQYLIGYVDFFDCKIMVNKNVLVPRFETEKLVYETIKEIKSKFKNQKINILDCGTGSGCIAIQLKTIFPDSTVIAIDKSFKALSLAKKNALLNNVDIIYKRQKFANITEHNIDVIISNPPYIGYNDEIAENVKKYEPKKALFAKKDGLEYYDQILKKSLSTVNKKNLICFEIGYKQAEKITNLVNKYYPNSEIKVIQDFNKKDRIMIINN